MGGFERYAAREANGWIVAVAKVGLGLLAVVWPFVLPVAEPWLGIGIGVIYYPILAIVAWRWVQERTETPRKR